MIRGRRELNSYFKDKRRVNTVLFHHNHSIFKVNSFSYMTSTFGISNLSPEKPQEGKFPILELSNNCLMKRVRFKIMDFDLDSLQGLYAEVFVFLAAFGSNKFQFSGLSGRGVYRF